MTERNQDIRKAIKQAGLFLWQVAEVYGINDSNFSRLLRKELDVNTKAKIYSIVSELSERKKAS